MFTSQGPNLYKSSDGFSVEVVGRTVLRYRQANRQMFVDSEVLTGRVGWRLTRIQYENGIHRTTASRSPTQIATEFSTTFARPFAFKVSRWM
jgi:hypothetical protein